MAKTIQVVFDASDIQGFFDDGRSPLMTKAQAQKLLNKVKERAEEAIAVEGAKIIHELASREM